MRNRPLSDAERETILASLRAGTSVRATARQAGRSQGCVSKLARAAGVAVNVSATKKATEAHRDYAQAERLALLNRLFDKVGALLDGCTRPTELQSLAMTAGILIDKRRLEDGEATSRAEVNTSDARDRIARKLDELAARRAAKGAA